MSVEAMSAGSAVGATTAINTGPITPSFGGEFSGGIRGGTPLGVAPDLGGTHMPGFDNNAFFETFAMPTPSLNMPEGDIVNHGVSPFDNTKVLWQASPTAPVTDLVIQTVTTDDIKLSSRVIQEINEIPDFISEPEITLPTIGNDIVTDISPIQPIVSQLEPEVSSIQQTEKIINDPIAQTDPISDLDLQVNSFIQEISDNKLSPNVIVTEPDVNADVSTMPIEITQQEVVADAKQAVKVETALIAIGNTREEAHQTALKIFTQTQEKGKVDQQLPIQPKETFFEHDTKADDARKKAAATAVENVTLEIADKEIEIVTGHDIAKHMPGSQPDVNSEIAKDKDGSYENLIEQLESTGEITSTTEAGEIIDGLINENHAVRMTDILKAQEATKPEIKKVLMSGDIFKK